MSVIVDDVQLACVRHLHHCVRSPVFITFQYVFMRFGAKVKLFGPVGDLFGPKSGSKRAFRKAIGAGQELDCLGRGAALPAGGDADALPGDQQGAEGRGPLLVALCAA